MAGALFFLAPRTFQSFSLTKAMPTFWPKPVKLNPVAVKM